LSFEQFPQVFANPSFLDKLQSGPFLCDSIEILLEFYIA